MTDQEFSDLWDKADTMADDEYADREGEDDGTDA